MKGKGKSAKEVAVIQSKLKQRKDGSYVIDSESRVRAATALRAEREEELDAILNSPEVAALREDIAALTQGIEKFVIENYEASDGYEDDNEKLTKVVSYTRAWNPDKLRKILPTRLYKLVIKVSVDKDKLDELVKEGKIDRKIIEPAFEERPNAPYVKRTVKTTRVNQGDKLKEALGG